MSTTIGPYSPELAPALIDLWNRALGERYPLTERLWQQNIADDPNWRADDAFVLRQGDTITGFAVTRRFQLLDRYPAMAPIGDLGAIPALVIDPAYAGRGYGTQLLAAAEDHLLRQGATRCDIGGSVGHFLPGPPAENERALRFWQRHGYHPDRLVHDLQRSLADWRNPTMALPTGWRIAQGTPADQAGLLTFLYTSFPGRWYYHLADSLARGYEMGDATLLFAPSGEVAGFVATWRDASPLLGPATHWFPALDPQHGGIGPLGIAASARGQGLGLAIVAAAVDHLHRHGAIDCTIDWTNLTDFYGRLGFRPWRSYWRCVPKALMSAT